MSADQWLFTTEHLKSTPAVSLDKQSVLHELKRRNAGIEFLFRVGLQLKLCVTATFGISAPNLMG